MYCGFCATPIPQGKSFCSMDGKPLGQGRAFCMNCGIPLTAGVKFCGACGYEADSFGQSFHTHPGQCSNCMTRNEARVKTCGVCGKPLTNPIPAIKQSEQQRQFPHVIPIAHHTLQAHLNSPVRPNGQAKNVPQDTKPLTPVNQIQPAISIGVQPTHTDKGGTQKAKRYSSLVDNKGRVTIPKQVREVLGIKTAGTVVFTVEGGTVTVTASKSKKTGKNAS